MEIWFYLLAPALIRISVVAVAVLGLTSMAIRLTLIRHGLTETYFFPSQLCFFIAGMLVWRSRRSWIVHLPTGRFRWALFAGVAIITLFYRLWPIPGQRWIYYAVVAFLLPVLFDLTKNSNWDQWIGNLSYPLYLVHVLIIATLENATGRPHPLLALLVSLGCAILLLELVESRVDKWRQQRAAQVQADAAAIHAGNDGSVLIG